MAEDLFEKYKSQLSTDASELDDVLPKSFFQKAAELAGTPMIQKPFDPDQMNNMAHKLLSGSAAS